MNTRTGVYLGPVAAVVRRDFQLAWSYRTRFVTGLVGGFASVATFYYVSQLVNVGGTFSPGEYFAFVTVGIAIYQVLNATLNTPYSVLRQELVAGTFERLVLAPGGPVTSLISLVIFPAIYALLSVVALLWFAAVVFGIDLQWSTVPLALPLLVLTVVAFVPFGLLLQAVVIVGKRPPPGANYLIVALSLIGGFYFPVALLPGWIRWMSEVQPFTPATDLLRWALAGRSLPDPAWVGTTKLAGFALVALPLCAAALSAAVTLSRRRGTLLEY